MSSRKFAEEIFSLESAQIANLSSLLTDDYDKAVRDILDCKGKLIISGMGKSGLIGVKIAATLASTGTPSFFLHAAEAYHGDLGMIGREDILLLLSNSGETDEVLKVIPFLKRQGNTIIAITGNPASTLAIHSDYHLNVHVQQEGCPLNLAPMSSTTATLVMGDAIAATLMKMRGFRDEDFAQFHPGGSLGRRLLTKVEDVMHSENMPICTPDEDIKSIISLMSSRKFGLAVVMQGRDIVGVVTDGDVRRAMEDEDRFFALKAEDIMSRHPKCIAHDARLTAAQEMMTTSKINTLLVSKDDTLAGIVQIYDLGL